MWADLLPRLVGSTLVDDDGPDQPTLIIGYKLEPNYVEIVGRDFSFGGAREFFGVSAPHDEPAPGQRRRLFFHGYTMSATVFLNPKLPTVTLPESKHAVQYDPEPARLNRG